MAFKLVVVLAFVGIASAYVASPLTLISPNQFAPLSVAQVQQEPLPQYTYNYGVHDSISGDSKTQTETRQGDSVKGEYSVNDADGFKRTVTYTADSANGFQAVVDRKPIADVAADIQASIAAQSVVPSAAALVTSTPLAYNAPLIVNSAPIAAPLAYNAPLIVNSARISAPLLSYNAPLIVNSSPIISSLGPATIINPSVIEPSLNLTQVSSPLSLASGPY